MPFDPKYTPYESSGLEFTMEDATEDLEFGWSRVATPPSLHH